MTAIGEARALARTAGATVRCPRGSMSLTDRLLRRDPETRALRALARGVERLPERRCPEAWGGKTSCGPPILMMQTS